jgi:2-desacetyl-2-hydroxyethyl bacteriochlorophyllide A dehydrogenase
MKAAVLVEPGKIEIQDIDIPKIGPDEILVKLKTCGICTVEQRLYKGDMKIFFPIIPGHEASGEIIEVGPKVIGSFSPGMPVALDLVTRCGECYYCRTGKSNMCVNRYKKGQRVLGGFAEYRAVRGSQVYPLIEGTPFREAAFSEPVACCIRSLKKVGLSLAEDVLVLGAGPMGLMHLQVALTMGARVFVSDPDVKRLKTAELLGSFRSLDTNNENLKSAIFEETEGRGVDACIVTSSSREALTSGLEVLGKTGRLNIYTSYLDKPPIPIDANTVHRTEVMITGSEARTEYDFHQAVRLIGFKKIDVEPLISKVIGFDEVTRGIEEAMSPETFRVLLENER